MSQLFPSAEAAWFWTAAALGQGPQPRGSQGQASQRHGVQSQDNTPKPLLPAPCRPEEVLRCLDSLYRARRIVLLHAHVLRHYGRRGRAPSATHPRERCDHILWTEAMRGLAPKLRKAGIVADPFAGMGWPSDES